MTVYLGISACYNWPQITIKINCTTKIDEDNQVVQAKDKMAKLFKYDIILSRQLYYAEAMEKNSQLISIHNDITMN